MNDSGHLDRERIGLRTVAVFGGTGFLGRRVVQHLLDHGFAVRVASRHPERGKQMFGDRGAVLKFIRADICEETAIRNVISGAFGVVNAVSLYVERAGRTFHSVHVQAAAKLARHSRDCGVVRLVHVSGIGASTSSSSPYIRSRGEGEKAVRAALPAATVVRPAVMFGSGDAFLTPLTELLRKSPVFPTFGSGETRLQPAYVEDVGAAIARIFAVEKPETAYEFAGPRTYTYKALLQTLSNRLGLRRTLLPVPFPIWQALAFAAEFLPEPPVTRGQVELMAIDSVASPGYPGLAALGGELHGIEEMLDTISDAGASGRLRR